MPFTVKLDEDLAVLVSEPLQAVGYVVTTVLGEGWSGLRDGELWPRICAEELLFITADRGFGDAQRFAPGTHAGILVLQPATGSIVDYRALLAHVLATHRLETLARAVTVATPHAVRIRRPPLSAAV